MAVTADCLAILENFDFFGLLPLLPLKEDGDRFWPSGILRDLFPPWLSIILSAGSWYSWIPRQLVWFPWSLRLGQPCLTVSFQEFVVGATGWFQPFFFFFWDTMLCSQEPERSSGRTCLLPVSQWIVEKYQIFKHKIMKFQFCWWEENLTFPFKVKERAFPH